MALLDQQAGLYEQLHTLSAQQSSLVDGQPDALLNVLVARQKLVDQLVAANTQMERFRAQWAAVTDGLAPEQKQRINATIERITSLRDAILHRDEADCHRLSHNRNELAREIARVHVSGRAVRAYSGAAAYNAQLPTTSRFTDSRG
jgi:hypothetical protein